MVSGPVADGTGRDLRLVLRAREDVAREAHHRRVSSPVSFAGEPVSAGDAPLAGALQQMDAASRFTASPHVASTRPGGVAAKRAVVGALGWYLRHVTDQAATFSASTAGALHVLSDELASVRSAAGQAVQAGPLHRPRSLPAGPAGAVPVTDQPDAWWVGPVRAALGRPGGPGRVMVARAGGDLIRVLGGEGFDAYGVDPDPAAGSVDPRAPWCEIHAGVDVVDHLGHAAAGSLAGIVLCAVVEGLDLPGVRRLLAFAHLALRHGGVLAVHSMTREAWAAADAPLAADLSPGRPIRSATWPVLLAEHGFEAAVTVPRGAPDYLVVARRSTEDRAG